MRNVYFSDPRGITLTLRRRQRESASDPNAF